MPSHKPTDPIHPGEIPLAEFMKPAGISIDGLALALRVPAIRVREIVNETCDITVDTALRLGCCFLTTSEFWMNLQTRYDLDRAA